MNFLNKKKSLAQNLILEIQQIVRFHIDTQHVMGFNNIQLICLLILSLPLAATADVVGEENGKDQEMAMELSGLKRMVTVDRRGGSVGGHAVGGRGAAHGNGNRGPKPNVMPFYAAGALPHRHNSQQHHNGSNQANLSLLLLILLLALYFFQYFA